MLPNTTKWQTVTLPNGKSCMAADLPSAAVADNDTIRAVFIDGKRQTLARYPNADAEQDLFPKGYATCDSWGAYRDDMGSGQHRNISSPTRIKDSGPWAPNRFDTYQYLAGGPSAMWNPPAWSTGGEAFSFDDLQDYSHKIYGSLIAAPADAPARRAVGDSRTAPGRREAQRCLRQTAAKQSWAGGRGSA